jgi:hypothetical protein
VWDAEKVVKGFDLVSGKANWIFWYVFGNNSSRSSQRNLIESVQSFKKSFLTHMSMVLDHFTEKSFHRKKLPKGHLTETPFDRTPFDQISFDRKYI